MHSTRIIFNSLAILFCMATFAQEKELIIRQGHGDVINMLLYAPDGKQGRKEEKETKKTKQKVRRRIDFMQGDGET